MTAQILNDITLQFNHATINWHDYLFPIANKLFGLLATLEIVWSAICWSIEKQDVTSLWTEMVKRIFAISIFYAILLNSTSWLPAIINSFVDIGAGASGHTQLHPSAIMDQGISIAENIFKVFHETGVFSFGFPTIVGAITGFGVILSFTIIACLLVVTLVESYIVLGGSVLMLGFGSSRISKEYAVKCMSYAMGVGVKLFMLYLIVGVGCNLADHWIIQFSVLSKENLTPFLEVLGGAIVYVYCAYNIPNKAESMISGVTNSSLGGIVASASLTSSAINTVSNTAKGTVGGAMGAASSGIEAIKQSKSTGEQLGGGIAGHAAGAAVAGFNLAASGIGSMTGAHKSTSAGMKEKSAGLNNHFAQRAEKNAANNSRPTYTPPPTVEASSTSNTPVEKLNTAQPSSEKSPLNAVKNSAEIPAESIKSQTPKDRVSVNTISQKKV